jgi:hypothetical protein
MKIAVLINHKTAAVSFSDVLKKLNHDIYIPLQCGIEVGAFSGKEVSAHRTLANMILDRHDLYNTSLNTTTIDDLYEELLTEFDAIITYHPINATLNQKLSRQFKVKVYVVLWGELDGVVLHQSMNSMMNDFKRNNHSFIVCHKHLFKHICFYHGMKYLPLGIPSYVEDMYSTHTGHLNFILIIQSRLNNSYWSEFKHLIDFVASHNPDYTFVVCGKDNQDVKFSSQNIITLYLKKHEDLLKFMSISKLMICNNTGSTTLQYSPIESACIGLPFIYHTKHTSLVSEIGKVPDFMYTSSDSCSERIRHLMKVDMNELKQKAMFQRKLADTRRLNSILPYWEFEFENIYK